jgi:hypothetical protein
MKNFRMWKSTLFHITDKLKPTLMKKNTKYKYAILVEIHVSCVVYKFVHGCNFLIYSKLVAIGKFTISLVPHEFVDAVNVVFRKLISWLVGVEMCSIMNDFKLWCSCLTYKVQSMELTFSFINLLCIFQKIITISNLEDIPL